MFGITNYKTTLPGIAAILTATATILNTIGAGDAVTPTQWGVLLVAVASVLNGFGNIAAKDKDVTGGTVPQSQEAKARVLSTPLSAEQSMKSTTK